MGCVVHGATESTQQSHSTRISEAWDWCGPRLPHLCELGSILCTSIDGPLYGPLTSISNSVNGLWDVELIVCHQMHNTWTTWSKYWGAAGSRYLVPELSTCALEVINPECELPDDADLWFTSSLLV